jgi:mono/diheme cytochrome c family protein
MSEQRNQIVTTTGEAEPTMGRSGAPAWLFVTLPVLFFWGMMYLETHAGGFNPQVYEPYYSLNEVKDNQPSSGSGAREKGRQVFGIYCSACHQSTGMGSPGQFPPLAGSEWVLAQGPNRIIRVVLNGFTGPVEVKGQQFNNTMTPFRDSLSDEEIAAVLTYVRSEWGNNAPEVVVEQVKAIRTATESRGGPELAPELQNIPEGEPAK